VVGEEGDGRESPLQRFKRLQYELEQLQADLQVGFPPSPPFHFIFEPFFLAFASLFLLLVSQKNPKELVDQKKTAKELSGDVSALQQKLTQLGSSGLAEASTSAGQSTKLVAQIRGMLCFPSTFTFWCHLSQFLPASGAQTVQKTTSGKSRGQAVRDHSSICYQEKEGEKIKCFVGLFPSPQTVWSMSSTTSLVRPTTPPKRLNFRPDWPSWNPLSEMSSSQGYVPHSSFFFARFI